MPAMSIILYEIICFVKYYYWNSLVRLWCHALMIAGFTFYTINLSSGYWVVSRLRFAQMFEHFLWCICFFVQLSMGIPLFSLWMESVKHSFNTNVWLWWLEVCWGCIRKFRIWGISKYGSLSIFFIDLVFVFSSLAYPNLLGTQKGFVLVAWLI